MSAMGARTASNASSASAPASASTSTSASEPAPSGPDRAAKRDRVLDLLDRRGASSLVLRSHTALAWYLDGARTHVSLAGDPVLAAVVSRSGDELRVFANEADRLLGEELGDLSGATVTEVPWYEALAPAGIAELEEADVADELRAVRASLLPAELDRYRRLSREVAEALTDAATGARRSDTEREVAARLAGDLVARGIDPLVILVAGRARLGHRHPLPTDASIGDRAMLVVCGRRHGLIANATRWVRWGASPAEDAAQRRILDVEAAFLDGTRVGGTIAEAFRAGITAYGPAGFDAEEWRRHHQGGAAGYAGRDPRATAAVADVVRERHAFAWNPTAPGAKVEDTVLVDDGGVEVLTVDPRWPVIDVGGRPRPIELVRVGLG